MTGPWHLLFDVVVLLSASLLLGGILARLGQSALVGFLLAGMLLGGPGSLHVVRSEKEIEAVAELGVSLLLFSLGLEFSWERLRSLGSRALMGGALQVVVTLVIGATVGLLFGLPAAEAVAVGAMVALSSTACVLRVLMDRGAIDSAHGRNGVAVLLVQDVAVVPLAVLMTVLAGSGSPKEIALDVGRIVLLAAALIVGLYLLLNKIAVWALGTFTLFRNRELTVLLAVVTGLGATWAAHYVRVSPALGAFVAGMFLGGSPFATQIRADVSSLRVVLLTLFFGAAGMVADPVWIVEHWSLVLSVSILLIAGKTLIVWAILRLIGQVSTVALATGLTLAQIGEFAFLLGGVGRESGVVSESTHQLVTSCTIVTLFATPFLVPIAPQFAHWLMRRFNKRADARTADPNAAKKEKVEIVIVGFGPAGQLASQSFLAQARHVVVVDLSQQLCKKASEMGFQAEIGDATQVDVLEHARVDDAHTVLITIPDHSTALTMLAHVRRLAPSARIIARSRYSRYKHEFDLAGAHVVVGDEDEVGRELARHALELKSNDVT